MTLTTWERGAAEEADTEAAGGSASAAPGRRRRRVFWIVVFAIVIALVATAVTVGVRRAAHRGVPLDPGNPGREGAQAVASVLDQRGVEVEVSRDQDSLLSAPAPGAGTTVVVTGTAALSEETARTMLDRVRGADRLVLVQPGRFVLNALGLPIDPSGTVSPADGVRAGCSLDGLAADDTITPDGRTYSSSGPGVTACFLFSGDAQLVALAAAPGRPEVLVLGDAAVLRNSEITRLDNAGVAVRLLGRGERLLWYVPSPLDIASYDTTPTSEVPRAIGPLVLLAFLGLIVLMVWRGRRFGPLVVEPLPAVVKAIETTESRGRLYRKARDTGRAGQTLRARECRRLGSYLGLPAGAAPTAVAREAAAAAGRDPAVITALLAGPPVQGEDALLALAHDLSELEKDVRRT
jgi:hypothetical protein